MNRRPLVSVVIIFLNAEEFLEEAIESVWKQTYRNWELMLVDDGSSDSSTAIARRYAAADPARVRYLEHPDHANRGMSASRNLGARGGGGEYVAFLDADDVWLPRKLEEQVAILESQPAAGVVYGMGEDWHSWSRAGRPDQIRELGVPAETLVEPPSLLTLFLQGRERTPCPSDILVRRSALERVGGFEDAFRGLYEDQAFLAKVYLESAVFVSGRRWSRHRKHPNSFMAVVRRSGPKHPPGLEFLGWLEKYLTNNRVEDEALWGALRKKQWRYRHPGWHRRLRWVRRSMRPALALARRVAHRAAPTTAERLPESHWNRSE
jgi:glycosyltransferase involved in cell wall biosynthesis